MASLKTRVADKQRVKSPTWNFQTRKLQGVPEESKAEREEKDKAKREWLKRNPVTKCKAGWSQGW